MRNFGIARKFNIVVVDAHKFVGNVEPKELTIDAHGSSTVHIDVSIPAGTSSGVGDDVVIVAKSVEEKPTSNSAIIHLLVTSTEMNPR